MEEWAQIPEFPGYSISSHGRVRNDYTDRILALTMNPHGITQVGLMRDGRQHKRGVALLVAGAFLERAEGPFDTPINLDGHRDNCHIENLMWRPRWFAVKYHAQFKTRGRYHIDKPLRERNTHVVCENSWDACTKFGLLEQDLVLAVLDGHFVFPTYQEFEIVKE